MKRKAWSTWQRERAEAIALREKLESGDPEALRLYHERNAQLVRNLVRVKAAREPDMSFSEKAARLKREGIQCGAAVRHKPTGAVRRVCAVRGDVVHFSQVIKREGATAYWASLADCEAVR